MITEKHDKLIRTYSENGFLLQKVGTNEIYSEAWDLADSKVKYIELEEKIAERDTNCPECGQSLKTFEVSR